MRISDWSSDVCSSDLQSKTLQPCSGSACSSAHGGSELSAASSPACACTIGYCGSAVSIDGWTLSASARPCACAQSTKPCGSGNSVRFQSQPFHEHGAPGDRKSVVLGKSVSVRVDLGGSRVIKKKK